MSSSLFDGDLSYICNAIGAPNMQSNFPLRYNDLAFKKSGDVIGIINGGILTRTFNEREKFIPIDILSEGSYKHELIYNGKSKDTIRLSYREYANDMARPAFYQDLTYDLSESREIAFRDLRIEVLEATNLAIKFIGKK